MLKRSEILEILETAKRIDSRYKLPGADKHKYRLNPPISASFVRALEEKYSFTFPTDYFHFITEIGDGGAGPYYGIFPFEDFMKKDFYTDYRNSLKNEFAPRPMKLDDTNYYIVTPQKDFLENPSKYYVYEKADKDSDCLYDGIYPFCTPGCYSDFCLVVTGEMRGKILYTDNMGAYELIANSFEEFYQNWLNCISDTENLHKEIGERRIFGKKTIFGYLHKLRFIPHRKPSDNP
ncbi:MAG: SMI1/KNR4 family protein [Ruminococcus sp.]|nr:SMI1/KNR4 family protein [Ruminococcus sp.]